MLSKSCAVGCLCGLASGLAKNAGTSDFIASSNSKRQHALGKQTEQPITEQSGCSGYRRLRPDQTIGAGCRNTCSLTAVRLFPVSSSSNVLSYAVPATAAMLLCMSIKTSLCRPGLVVFLCRIASVTDRPAPLAAGVRSPALLFLA